MDTVSQVIDKMRFSEPPEVARIKQYVQDKYHLSVQVSVHPNQIVIATNSSALAGTLRMELHHIQTAARTKKRLILRISG